RGALDPRRRIVPDAGPVWDRAVARVVAVLLPARVRRGLISYGPVHTRNSLAIPVRDHSSCPWTRRLALPQDRRRFHAEAGRGDDHGHACHGPARERDTSGR